MSPRVEGIGGTGIRTTEGIGGTGQKVAEGIGGTGQKLADGIGGTGQKVADGIGGTGIVGTVTDFGSIWINHAHVHFDNTTRITANGEDVSQDAFKLGHLVAVLSDPVKNGYHARSIDIVYEVIGPIEAIHKDKNEIQILKQKIKLDKETLITSEQGRTLKFSYLQTGQFAKISGLRKGDGSILASRIDLVNAVDQVQLIGKLEGSALAGQLVSIGTEITLDIKDDRIRISGRLVDDVLIADDISKDSIVQVIEQATDLLLEGFMFEQAFEGDIVVGGIELVLPDELESKLIFDADEAIFIDASLGQDDLFYAEDFMFLLEGAEDFMDFDYENEEWIEELETVEPWIE